MRTETIKKHFSYGDRVWKGLKCTCLCIKFLIQCETFGCKSLRSLSWLKVRKKWWNLLEYQRKGACSDVTPGLLKRFWRAIQLLKNGALCFRGNCAVCWTLLWTDSVGIRALHCFYPVFPVPWYGKYSIAACMVSVDHEIFLAGTVVHPQALDSQFFWKALYFCWKEVGMQHASVTYLSDVFIILGHEITLDT